MTDNFATLEKEFINFLGKSDEIRPDYTKSLLPCYKEWKLILDKNINDIPDFFKVVYSKVAGTLYTIENQKFMDFLPGYLLIHISEYNHFYKELNSILESRNIGEVFFPILRNYSSDFIGLKANSNEIYNIMHDDYEIQLMHKNPLSFLKTINDFYDNKVYFADEDGYLDSDFNLELEIGLLNNPEAEFWQEE